jgi:hypothetical protein
MKNDACSSILIKVVYLIAALLGSVIHIDHFPRCSDWASEMADNLSRETATVFLESRERFSNVQKPSILHDWLNNPTEDWNLSFKLLSWVSNKIKYPINYLFIVLIILDFPKKF